MFLRSILKFSGGRALVLGIGALALLLRLLAVPAALGTMDEVHFASALTRYDLLHQSPHAPGYPVYVVLARLFRGMGANEVWALAGPGILLATVTIPWLASVVARRWGAKSGAVVGLVLAATPLAVVVGAAPASDAIGFALCVGVIAAVLAESRRSALIAGALFGMLLGARLSHAPLAVAALAWLVWRQRESIAPVLAGTLVATVVWLVPFVAIVGFDTLRELVPGFARGHFTQWGKGLVAAGSAGDATLWLRWIGLGVVMPWVGMVAWRDLYPSLAPASLRFPFPLKGKETKVTVSPSATVDAVPATRVVRHQSPKAKGILWFPFPLRGKETGATQERGKDRGPLLIALITTSYAAWMLLAQNPEHARHVVPLVIPFALILGLLSESLSRAHLTFGATTAIAATIMVTLPIRTTLPAAAQLSDYLAAHEQPESFQLFGGSEVAVVQHDVPMYRAARPTSETQLIESTESLRRHHVRVLATSTIERRGEVIATFDEPSVFAWPRSLQLLIPQRGSSERALTMVP